MKVGLGDRVFDTEIGRLTTLDGESVELRPQSVEVLKLLVENQDELVEKSEFMRVVWADVVVTDDSLTKCIGDIRRALGSSGREILHTVPKRGYRLVQGVPLSNSAILENPASLPLKKKLGIKQLVLPLGLLLVLVLFALQHFRSTPALNEQSNSTTIDRKPVLYVEYFSVQGADDNSKILADGVSLDVVVELTRNKWLKVHHLAQPFNVAQARESTSNNQYLLTGKFRKTAEMVKLTITLSKPLNQQMVWAQTLEAPIHDFFDLQDSLVELVGVEIGSEWSGALASDALTAIRNRPTENFDAYESMLVGAVHMRKFNPEDSQIALEKLRHAVTLDPHYGEAWAILAKALMLDKDHASSEEERANLVREQAIASTKAFEYAPYHIDSKIQYSWLTARKGDYVATEKLLRDAAADAVNNPDVLAHIAWAGSERVSLGEDAVFWATRAIELSDIVPNWYNNALAAALFNNGDAEAALDVLQTTPDDLSRWVYEAASAAYIGNKRLASTNVTKILEQNPAFRVGSFFESVPMLDDVVRNRLRQSLLTAGLPL